MKRCRRREGLFENVFIFSSRYNLYVDCMPIHHIDPMDARIYSNMRNRAVSTPGINPEEEMLAALCLLSN